MKLLLVLTCVVVSTLGIPVENDGSYQGEGLADATYQESSLTPDQDGQYKGEGLADAQYKNEGLEEALYKDENTDESRPSRQIFLTPYASAIPSHHRPPTHHYPPHQYPSHQYPPHHYPYPRDFEEPIFYRRPIIININHHKGKVYYDYE